MKTTAPDGIHEFHSHSDFLCASTSHLNEEELELQEDMKSAHANIGTAQPICIMFILLIRVQGTLNPLIIGPDILAL
jgi:hypothetical protein